MSTAYSPEIAKFIEEEMATGRYQSETEVTEKALRVFKNLKAQHQEIKREIELSIEDEKNGRFQTLNVDQLIANLESEVDELGQPIA